MKGKLYMGFWYDGNKNYTENRREKKGITYYIRGVAEVDGKRLERYAVHTHFIGRGEDLTEILEKYVKPLYKEGDIVAIGEKVVSMCQDNTVEKEKVKLGFLAKTLSKFAVPNSDAGIGMGEPYKLQLAINMKGAPLIIWAAFCGGVGKIFGKRGVFYKIVGQDIAGIDGFYEHSAFDTYHDLAVLNPKDPDGVCKTVKEKTDMDCMIIDANDISVEILGRSEGLRIYSEKFLEDSVRDNPAGQDDELTPFIIIRDIGDKKAEPYVPMKAREEQK